MMLLVAKTEKGSLYIQSKFIPADYRVGANYEKKYVKKKTRKPKFAPADYSPENRLSNLT